jgi:hypothetical protein
MQSSAQEQARVREAMAQAAEGRAMRVVAARLGDDHHGFLRNAHRAVESAVVMLIGVTMTTLALYNLAVWLAR